jgi:DNA-directed RNA polymerase specialized sigma24 family protein
MSRKGGQVGVDQRTTSSEPDQNKGTALQRVLENNVQELIWVAEVMAGSRPAGEQCLAKAIELAESAQYVGEEWMLSWVKRLLVHVALKRISGEIRELLPAAGTRSAVTQVRAGMSVRDRQMLRSISPQRIAASLDVLERACFILHVYLAYPVLDCALLLGCPRGWIESICDRVLVNIVAVGPRSDDASWDVDSINSPGVTECAG